MKKTIFLILAVIMTLALLTGCEVIGADEPDDLRLVSVKVETESGGGQVAVSEDGETPEFSEGFPVQSVLTNVEKDSTIVIAAKAGDGAQFVKWLKNGEDFSTEELVEVTASQDTQYVAVFEKTDG